MSQPLHDPGRQWNLTDLLDSPRRLGLAEAHARYGHNASARAVLVDLAHAINALSAEPTGDAGEEPT